MSRTMEVIETIGDIEVLANEDFAQVTVDGEIVITVSRSSDAITELAVTLAKLAK